MPGYTSYSDMQRAKKLHGCDMSIPRRQEAASPRSSADGSYSARISHAGFEHDKVRHQAEVLNSPPRERGEPPKRTVYGHTHDELSSRGPPYHKSCREFGHEKDEHLTPILPDRSGSARGTGGCGHANHGDGQCKSNETFSEVKRKHNHELDSCSPRRSARGDAAYGASPARSDRSAASAKCTSSERFRADKAMHRHGIDECQDKDHLHAHAADSPDSAKSPRCTSAEHFRAEKQRHNHGIDDCQEKPAAPAHTEEEHNGQCKSVERFTKNKHAHRHGMDECHPKPPAEPTHEMDEHGPCRSYTALSKKKKNHDHALDSCSPDRPARKAVSYSSPPTHDKSNIALNNLKKSHAKDMSGPRLTSTSPSHCISNEVYADDKKKHKHLVDECRDGSGSPHRHGAGCGHAHGDGDDVHCTSLAKLDNDKRRHSHLIDSCRSEQRDRELSERREREGAAGGTSPRCKSNHSFAENKRGHRHLMDGCSPGREHDDAHHGHGHDHDHTGVCTSNQAFTHDKRSNRIGMDDCRTPRRELFDQSPPPTHNDLPEAAVTPATPDA